MRRKNQKIRELYLAETLEEEWKRTSDGQDVEIGWVEKDDVFVCVPEKGESYNCNYSEFFRTHVIRSNMKIWKSDPKNSRDLYEKQLSSWLCLINGYNVFEDFKKSWSGGVVASEGGNLLKYILQRYEDVQWSLNHDTVPNWLAESTLERFDLH